MKLKYYLRGLGIGIVVTTILFMIFISLHKNETGSSNLNDEKEDSTTVAALEKETESGITDMEEFSGQSPQPDSKPDADKKKDTEKKEENSSESEQKLSEEKVRLEIRGGEFSDVICRKLKEMDVIDDAEAFNDYLVEKDYDNFILPGVYDIPKDATYEEIAGLLTTKVKSP